MSPIRTMVAAHIGVGSIGPESVKCQLALSMTVLHVESFSFFQDEFYPSFFVSSGVCRFVMDRYSVKRVLTKPTRSI